MYLAKSKFGNYYKFQWTADNRFLVQEFGGRYIEDDANKYEIVQIEEVV